MEKEGDLKSQIAVIENIAAVKLFNKHQVYLQARSTAKKVKSSVTPFEKSRVHPEDEK